MIVGLKYQSGTRHFLTIIENWALLGEAQSVYKQKCKSILRHMYYQTIFEIDFKFYLCVVLVPVDMCMTDMTEEPCK